ncbi:hypothetical protein NC652_009003 [Populus alba x Populus x berolinensis]|uniref:Uncharacterized protein n=1 Tax=Populus alba x Populus x berolinensis TaxID=444605 RepID=A0AAD6W991_9ROSI|nr:hypothetical protein NC651_008824 [Populus alba x Populus x berolinensis]KAJ6943401.1 hypothetical protein NC652_009003 [Populus alba x Populus x berolinensis]KAJ7003998.1 hypothetical protein NC653_009015 [Populus alba x Populus x berolinensis]
MNREQPQPVTGFPPAAHERQPPSLR